MGLVWGFRDESEDNMAETNITIQLTLEVQDGKMNSRLSRLLDQKMVSRDPGVSVKVEKYSWKHDAMIRTAIPCCNAHHLTATSSLSLDLIQNVQVPPHTIAKHTIRIPENLGMPKRQAPVLDGRVDISSVKEDDHKQLVVFAPSDLELLQLHKLLKFGSEFAERSQPSGRLLLVHEVINVGQTLAPLVRSVLLLWLKGAEGAGAVEAPVAHGRGAMPLGHAQLNV